MQKTPNRIAVNSYNKDNTISIWNVYSKYTPELVIKGHRNAITS